MEEAFLSSAIHEVEDAIIRDFEKLRLNAYDLDMERERNERGRYSALLEDAQNIEFSIEKLIAIRKMLQDQTGMITEDRHRKEVSDLTKRETMHDLSNIIFMRIVENQTEMQNGER